MVHVGWCYFLQLYYCCCFIDSVKYLIFISSSRYFVFNYHLQVRIDDAKVESGSLEEDWDILLPQEINDPAQSKPKDWVDAKTIADPEDKKPEVSLYYYYDYYYYYY